VEAQMDDSRTLIEQSRQLIAAARDVVEESRRIRAEAQAITVQSRRIVRPYPDGVLSGAQAPANADGRR
jgi:hypothetical protein